MLLTAGVVTATKVADIAKAADVAKVAKVLHAVKAANIAKVANAAQTVAEAARVAEANKNTIILGILGALFIITGTTAYVITDNFTSDSKKVFISVILGFISLVAFISFAIYSEYGA